MENLTEFLGFLPDSLNPSDFILRVYDWVLNDVLIFSSLIQLVAIAVAYLVARPVAPLVERLCARIGQGQRYERSLRQIANVIQPLAMPVAWLILQWLSLAVAVQAGWPHHFIQITVSLLTAWVIIRLGSRLVRDPVWSKAIALTAWSIAALNILNLLDDTVLFLDSLALEVGALRVSALTVIKGVMSLAVLLWLATASSRVLEKRISSLPNLTPSVQVLFSKLLKIVLIVVAVVVALRSVGIDLTAFAVLSGAIGVGIGFGLQKAVSNLISGVMLLLDKSIKPGDVVSVAGTYGWVSSLGARYVSVVTRDGIEHLIPNEDFITQGVENWSYSNEQVRLKVPIGISYNADPRLAIKLCLEAAAEVERVLTQPNPVCLVKGFGDNSVDLELRIWINDPPNGVSNVKSQALLLVWDKFHQHGIEIPFPQRDLHIKDSSLLTVRTNADGGDDQSDDAGDGTEAGPPATATATAPAARSEAETRA